MEIRYSHMEPSGNNSSDINKNKTGLTPRELIHYHINNPDQPILDEDIENLVLDIDDTTFTTGTPTDAE